MIPSNEELTRSLEQAEQDGVLSRIEAADSAQESQLLALIGIFAACSAKYDDQPTKHTPECIQIRSQLTAHDRRKRARR